MNGEPLPLEHGFPVRMVVPGLYGYVSATKWLTDLKVTTFAADQAYWTPRGYSAKAPIKLSSRIDTPRVDKPVAAGPTKIAGVAWAQTVGIQRVEVRIDGGEWMQATLSAPVNTDTWVQWSLDWDATPGSHTLVGAGDRPRGPPPGAEARADRAERLDRLAADVRPGGITCPYRQGPCTRPRWQDHCSPHPTGGSSGSRRMIGVVAGHRVRDRTRRGAPHRISARPLHRAPAKERWGIA